MATSGPKTSYILEDNKDNKVSSLTKSSLNAKDSKVSRQCNERNCCWDENDRVTEGREMNRRHQAERDKQINGAVCPLWRTPNIEDSDTYTKALRAS
ncbi:unnamed protein product [Cercopithifilaria johnstoni]|uniref:Uncharacterized protein n=1 Tax=Cercopithifilaria johnstoni TaxID=2874296 RepID=A0A8J2M4S2_9BILA|nr:unnamed protein product [Cercopithifilaria johnstoni]